MLWLYGSSAPLKRYVAKEQFLLALTTKTVAILLRKELEAQLTTLYTDSTFRQGFPILGL